MNTKLFFSIVVYIFVLGLYFLAIKVFDGKSNKFEVMLFDYPRHGVVLCLAFFTVNLFFSLRNHLDYSENGSYSFVFFWLPFMGFLLITAIVNFYGLVSIGAPVKQNVFINLLLAHTIAFMIIKVIIKYKPSFLK